MRRARSALSRPQCPAPSGSGPFARSLAAENDPTTDPRSTDPEVLQDFSYLDSFFVKSQNYVG